MLNRDTSRKLRRGCAGATAVMAVAIAGAGAAGASPGHGHRSSAGQAATGSAINQYPTAAGPGSARLTVFARNNSAGAAPSGYVSAQGDAGAPASAFSVGGRVTCVRFSGNKAAIKYRFDRASGSAAPFAGGGVEVFVEDNGKPSGGHPVDANAFTPPQPAATFDAAATQCDDPNTAAYDTVESGDYTVGATHGQNGHRGHHRAPHHH
jgi:hypothetical protein